ncbi:MAG: pilus assembly protein [Cellvibrionaceae bacterium]
MVQSDQVNITSLNLVSDELVATIEQSAAKLEQFVGDTSNSELLAACVEGIEQISGTLRLIQLFGAEMLANEILSVAKDIDTETGDVADETLSVLTSSFFILPRYLEYTQQTRRGMPVLLIPYINELRQCRKQPPIPECEFFDVDTSYTHKPKSNQTFIEADDLNALIRRLRHMFQVGLLNTLQGKQTRSALGIMQRALERLEIISGDRAKTKLWWVGSAALEVLRTNNMELNKARKMVLTAIDRQIKGLLSKGLQGFEEAAPEPLIKQLLFILALSHKPSDKSKQILNDFGVKPLDYSDQELRSEREALKGPSVNTVSSVAAVLTDELRAIKEILENASQASDKGMGEYDELAAHLAKVADILGVVGLVSASNTLKEEITRIEGWIASGEPADGKDLIDVADSLLYVESTVSGLENLNLSDEKLSQANSLARKEVIASSQLAEAENVVFVEAEAGLALVKRALNSFAESNYDHGHIRNVGATLTTVRGGMIMLNLDRASRVIAACVEFIDQTLLVNDQPVAIQQLLETFADAIIGLEYYLDAIKNDRSSDDSVLAIAEESLQALGHRVAI